MALDNGTAPFIDPSTGLPLAPVSSGVTNTTSTIKAPKDPIPALDPSGRSVSMGRNDSGQVVYSYDNKNWATSPKGPPIPPMQPSWTTPAAQAGAQAGAAPNPAIETNPAAASDVAASAGTVPPVGPVLGQWLKKPVAGTSGIDVWQGTQPALTKPPGNYQQAPSYLQASTDPNTGLPTTAGPQTKLGKLLSILRGAGMGAMAGSGQPTAGAGALAANQYFDQQAKENQARQMGAMQLATARENLQYMPLQRAWQLQNMQQNALLNQQWQQARTEEIRQRSEKEAAQTQRQQDLATMPKPFQVGDRMMRSALASDDPSTIGPSGYVDVGPAAPKGTPEQQTYDAMIRQGRTPQEALTAIAQTRQEAKTTTPEQDAFQAAYNEQIAKGKTPTEANAIAKGQQPATGNAPMVAPQALQQRLSQLPLEVQTGLQQFTPETQQALLALADGDANASAWSARGTYKNTGGLTQAQAIGWARAINPNWNEQLYGDRQKLYQDYQSTKAGTAGGNIRSFNDFLLHAGQAADVTDKWRQQFLINQSPFINTPMNKLRNRLIGDPDYTDFVTALEPVKKEYQAFLNNNRAEHTADLQQMDIIVNPDSTPAQIEAALKRMADTAVLRLDSLDQGFVQGSGGKQFPNLIHPAVRQSAGVAKLGIGNRLMQYQSGGYMPGYMQPTQTPQPAQPAQQAAQTQVPPTPTTHVFNAKAWGAANPGQDVNAAIAKAKAQGYRILQ